MRWNPDIGHVPRGFFGACGDLAEVELVLVVAEPGDPHPGESHSGLDSAYDYAGMVLRAERDPFHRNQRKIFEMCWANSTFEQQMRKVWLTESVLCSAIEEGAGVPRPVSRACGNHYLLAQLQLFPNALVVACGNKARDRLNDLGVSDFMPVWAVAPPGSNNRAAYESWKEIPVELARRNRGRLPTKMS